LSWSCSDPDGDALKYDIYLGTSVPPPLVMSNHTSTTYDPILENNTTYYWKVVAKDGYAETEGDIWSFTTVSPDTTPPETEIIEGPSGTINYNDVKFVWTGKDDRTPTSELVYSYKLEGYDSDWSPWTSNTSKEYEGLPNGNYTFKVKAKDKAGNVDPTPAERNFTVSVKFGVKLSCENPNKYVAPGETATYKIIVKNTGNRQDTISLSHSTPPSGWTASLDKTSVVLNAGESTEVILNVTPPKNAKDGDYALIDVIGKSKGNPSKSDVVTTNTTVMKENQPPIASFTYSPQHPKVNENITFNASSSYDPDGTIVKYEWDFGDGSKAEGKVVTHSYSKAGDYTVTLTVTDDEGATNSTTKKIPVPPPAPEANISFNPSKSIIGVGLTAEINLTLDKAQNGLSGYNITVSLSNATVAEISSVSFPDWATLHSNSTLPADSLWIKATDLYDKIKSGAKNITLATITLRGDKQGISDILVTVTKMDDDNENPIDPNTVSGKIEVIEVVPFPGCENPPTDPDRDGLYEDINGNGRKGFNDVVVFFNYLKWGEENQPCIECFDFNKNGRIDFDDVVKLFEEI